MHLHLGKVLTWLFLYSYLLFVCMKTDSSQVLKFHSKKSSTDRSLRPIISDVQQLLMSYHNWSVWYYGMYKG